MADAVEFMGAEFAIADKVGLMPLLKFAHAAKSGLDSADVDGMAAMYDLLQQCIADDAWAEFEAHAMKTRASDEELMAVVQKVISTLSARPTKQPSDSSDGPQSENTNSAADSSSLAVVHRLQSQGRPDLAMAVVRSQTG